MSIFTREEAIELLMNTFPLKPLPEKLSDSMYASDLTEHFIVFKDKIWKDVNLSNIKFFSGFTNAKYLIPSEYYFYYLPGILISVLEDLDFMDVAYEALLPNTKYFKINHQWLDFIAALDAKKISTLVIYFERCKRSFDAANVMEVDLLIELLLSRLHTDTK
jgi:hypothetical protein